MRKLLFILFIIKLYARINMKGSDVISDNTEDNAEKIIPNLKYIFQGGHSR